MARLGASLALVIWHDAHSEDSWSQLTDLDPEPYVVETVGFLLPDAKPGHVVIAQSIGSDDSMDSVLQIPVGMVVSVTTLGNPTRTPNP
jgi:hypothetical protein